MISTKVLERLSSPAELQRLSLKDLQELAEDIRELILNTVSKNGGHLAPSLGTVELTLALYSVFDFSIDKIVWDVGHQAYTHKILTGRKNIFHTLRTKGGISGFPRRSESKFDYFGVGHASTSISAALGLLLSEEIQNKFGKVIAVIGDGALTGGEAFEALNHAGQLKKNLIVILNDNEMSIAKNVGALSEYLSDVRLHPQYRKAKKDFEDFVKGLPMSEKILQAAYSVGYGLKSAIVPGNIFEAFGFTYLGPVDGHNIKVMQDIFTRARELDEPILIHVHTKKGKGYEPAEKFPEKFHGVGKFDKENGEVEKKVSPPTYTEIFSQAILELAEKNKKIVAITAAMPSGTGLKDFSKKFPERFFDVGIAEEHATTLAAGMAAGGLHPVVAIYSTFIQRAYDQILHDVCLQNLPVIFCLDRAGLVGEDGATLQSTFRDSTYTATDDLPKVDASALTKKLTLTGGVEDNTLIGGKGADLINGNAGDDLIIGNGGADTFVYSSGNDTIGDYGNGTDKISLTGALQDFNLDGDDVIIGFGSDSLTIAGMAGKKITFVENVGGRVTTQINIFAEDGMFNSAKTAQTLSADTTDFTAGTGIITIDGGLSTGEIEIVGNAKPNKIYAGNNGSTINGGTGSDSLWGGTGSDTFIYESGGGKDVIYGFDNNDALQIGGDFNATVKNNSIAFKVGSTANAITLKDYTADTFTINGDTYQISGNTLTKK